MVILPRQPEQFRRDFAAKFNIRIRRNVYGRRAVNFDIQINVVYVAFAVRCGKTHCNTVARRLRSAMERN